MDRVLVRFRSAGRNVFYAFRSLIGLYFLSIIFSANRRNRFRSITVRHSREITFEGRSEVFFTVESSKILTVYLSGGFALRRLRTLIRAVQVVACLYRVIVPYRFLRSISDRRLRQVHNRVRKARCFFGTRHFTQPFNGRLLRGLDRLHLIRSFTTFFAFSRGCSYCVAICDFVEREGGGGQEVRDFLTSFFIFCWVYGGVNRLFLLSFCVGDEGAMCGG